MHAGLAGTDTTLMEDTFAFEALYLHYTAHPMPLIQVTAKQGARLDWPTPQRTNQYDESHFTMPFYSFTLSPRNLKPGHIPYKTVRSQLAFVVGIYEQSKRSGWGTTRGGEVGGGQ